MPFAASFALALSAVISPAQIQSQPSLMPAAQTVQQYVESYFADTPILAKIAKCESHFRQFDKDGSVHRGRVNDRDVGIMQVNEYYHLTTADKLGLDIYSIQGNLAYAQYLYDREGSQPWSSSKPCWGKYETAADKVAVK